jgi:hypothetical protein
MLVALFIPNAYPGICSIYKAMPCLTVGEIICEKILRKKFWNGSVGISLNVVVSVCLSLEKRIEH